MYMARKILNVVALTVLLETFGCTAKTVDFSQIQRPPRASELDAFNVFVGTWDWVAKVVNASDADRDWTGTAEWNWTLDDRCLQGVLSAKSKNAGFEAKGMWSWHARQKKYTWWMFNNWGHPQQGTAKYDAESKSWHMPYRAVGLDGTASYGKYEMKVVDHDTLEWSMVEWADRLHLVRKLEMTGTYTRRK